MRHGTAAALLALLAAPPLARAAPPEGGAPAPPWSSLGVAASYGGAIRDSAFWQGPGVVLAADEPRWLADPGLWVEGRWVFPQASNPAGNVMQTISARAGVDARLSALVRLGVGGGFDRESMELTFHPLPAGLLNTPDMIPANWRPAVRLFGRLASRSWRGFSASATLFLDAVHSADPQNTFRAGVTVEGWWRSSGD
jgi:hypothetical protein